MDDERALSRGDSERSSVANGAEPDEPKAEQVSSRISTRETSRASYPGLTTASQKLLLEHLVPPTVILHERGDIVHHHGRTGRFLEPVQGSRPSSNIFNMARFGLETELSIALRQASTQEGECVRKGIRVRTSRETMSVDLRVRRLDQPEVFRGLFLVTFDNTCSVETEPDHVFDTEAALASPSEP